MEQIRTRRLTASNAGAALGLCPYTNRLQAFNRAMGVDRWLGTQFTDAVDRPRVTKESAMYAFYRSMGMTGNEATRWGTTHERDGVRAYTEHTGNAVQKTGVHVHVHPSFSWLSGSPDGLIGTEGMLEVKCPFLFKNGGTRVHKTIPAAYYMQINLCLEICGRDWCDFISWAPEEYAIYRVTRDNELHQAMAEHYSRFYAAMQTAALRPPELSKGEKEEIEERVRRSMEAHVSYTVWIPAVP